MLFLSSSYQWRQWEGNQLILFYGPLSIPETNDNKTCHNFRNISRCLQVFMVLRENVFPWSNAGQIEMLQICVLICHYQSAFGPINTILIVTLQKSKSWATTQFSFHYSSPSIVVHPYLQFHFLWFQLSTINHGPKKLNGKHQK